MSDRERVTIPLAAGGTFGLDFPTAEYDRFDLTLHAKEGPSAAAFATVQELRMIASLLNDAAYDAARPSPCPWRP